MTLRQQTRLQLADRDELHMILRKHTPAPINFKINTDKYTFIGERVSKFALKFSYKFLYGVLSLSWTIF